MPRILNSGGLYEIARNALVSIDPSFGDTRTVGSPPLVVLAFSSMALEAFINEFADIAQAPLLDPHYSTGAVKSVAALLSGADSERFTVQLKYDLALVALTGRPFDRGNKPYQDFDTLIKVRNALVHLKAERWEEDSPSPSPPFFQRLKPGIINPLGVSWVTRISTRGFAKFCCNTTVDMVQSVLTAVPEGHFKKLLVKFHCYEMLFSKVTE